MTRRTINQQSQILENLHDRDLIAETREIFIHSSYSNSDDEEPGVDYRMAVTFEKNLRFLQYLDKKKPILIHQHCIGGNWNDGLGIYDAIKHSSCHVTILVYAQASSMSSVILQAGDYRVLMPSCEILLHYGESTIGGIGDAVINAAKRIEETNDQLLDIYAERCQRSEMFKNWSIEDIKNYLDQQFHKKVDWYLNAEDAVKYGFADNIFGNEGCKEIDDLL